MQVEQLEQWIGAEVVDPAGEPVGKLTEVYFRGGEPVLISAKGGRLSRKRSLVPLDGATVSRDALRIAFPHDRLVETKSAEDQLTSDDLAAVAEHFGAAHTVNTDELEGSRARAERFRAADEAERQAAALEAEAAQRAVAAEDAEADAVRAAEAARQAHDERRAVTARAEAARDEAARRAT